MVILLSCQALVCMPSSGANMEKCFFSKIFSFSILVYMPAWKNIVLLLVYMPSSSQRGKGWTLLASKSNHPSTPPSPACDVGWTLWTFLTFWTLFTLYCNNKTLLEYQHSSKSSLWCSLDIAITKHHHWAFYPRLTAFKVIKISVTSTNKQLSNPHQAEFILYLFIH